jgi:acetoin utilization protein AcuB
VGAMKISKYMTEFPYTIAIDASVASARRMMLDHSVRHLPVLDGGNLVGIISDRELDVMETIKRTTDTSTTIELAFSRVVLKFSRDEPWPNVCRKMIEKKAECALICENRKLIGVFTWIDAMKKLLEDNAAADGRPVDL